MIEMFGIRSAGKKLPKLFPVKALQDHHHDLATPEGATSLIFERRFTIMLFPPPLSQVSVQMFEFANFLL